MSSLHQTIRLRVIRRYRYPPNLEACQQFLDKPFVFAPTIDNNLLRTTVSCNDVFVQKSCNILRIRSCQCSSFHPPRQIVPRKYDISISSGVRHVYYIQPDFLPHCRCPRRMQRFLPPNLCSLLTLHTGLDEPSTILVHPLPLVPLGNMCECPLLTAMSCLFMKLS